MKSECAVGIDLGGTHIRAARISPDYRILSMAKEKTPGDGAPDDVIAAIVRMVESLQTGEPRITGVGVGAPGPLNTRTGCVHMMPNLSGWSDVPLTEILSRKTGRAVSLVNDADAAALGEYVAGTARRKSLFVFLTLGTGLGSSLMVNGMPWVGAGGFSSEFGHLPLFDADDTCGCGRHAHVETRLSVRALWRSYHRHGGNMDESEAGTPPVKKLFDAAESGDAAARRVVTEYGRGLGRLIATVAAALNVRDFIIGGGISSAWEQLRNDTGDAVEYFGFSPHSDSISIDRSSLGDRAGLLGAASLVFNNGIRDV